ncbi:MAG: ABC transporter substrate-binding protein [Deltaproteobacteria bacterium]|nr:ABC transporter substrate-binding protein [Deltaproteobacteria bacterium]MDZ4342002.1 ABC transporter substrate-binding protein [Candidatus Binatia bacterium]
MKKLFRLLLIIAFLGAGPVTQAQQPARSPRIGILLPPSASFNSARVEAFRQRLRELGYVEGKNIFFEYRYAEGKLERLPDLAAELVRLKVDVIVTAGPAGPAAKKATATIPIVFATFADPVGSGIVSSLARPGGNITGLSLMTPDLDGKRLELLKESFPKVTRVAFLWMPSGSMGNVPLKDMEAAAKALGVKLQSLEVRSLDDFESAFARAKRDGAQALITYPGPLINTQQRQVLDFAAKNRLPAMYPANEFVEAGGLMSYAPNYTDLFRRAADFVDKILKGAKPVDLPVEQPMRFEFIVNLKTAKQIGVTIEPNVLVRANKVIR